MIYTGFDFSIDLYFIAVNLTFTKIYLSWNLKLQIQKNSYTINEIRLNAIIVNYDTIGHENKECLRSHDIDSRGEVEAVKHMRSNEGLFFRGRGQYTIFLHSLPENANSRSTPGTESWHFLATVQKRFLMKLKI